MSKPEPGPVSLVVVEFSDFRCEPCARVSGLLQQLADTGKVRLQVAFKHSPIGHPDAVWRHEASLAAADQGRFWGMHDWFFSHPDADPPGTRRRARELGLDLVAFDQALKSGRYRTRIHQDLLESQGLGVRVTPTIFVNGNRLEGLSEIETWVGAAVARLNRPAPPEFVDPAAFDLSGSPSLGPEDAAVTIVEFSDFQCGYCAANAEVLAQLMATFPGRVRRVFKHYPTLPTDEGRRPHLVAAAAWAQAGFWVTESTLRGTPPTTPEAARAYAEASGFDVAQFMLDLESPESLALVERDRAEGERLLIYSTPTIFINGRRLVGSQTLQTLVEAVEPLLHQPASQSSGGATERPTPSR